MLSFQSVHRSGHGVLPHLCIGAFICCLCIHPPLHKANKKFLKVHVETFSKRNNVLNYVPDRNKTYSRTCLQGSATGNYKSGLCWQGGSISERQKLPIRFSWSKLRLAFVDLKPLLADVLMHRFDCTIISVRRNV